MSSLRFSSRPEPPLFTYTLAVLGFLLIYIPLVTVVIYSFVRQSRVPGLPDVWTLEWYRKLLSNEEVLQAFYLSIIVAFWTTLGSTLMGSAAALGLEKKRFFGQSTFEFIAFIPIIMPEIVLGLSLLACFVFLRITLGEISIILSHIMFSVSYVLLTVRTRLASFDHTLEEAAQDLGAGPWQRFIQIKLPLIFPGILSGALMAFTLSFDDFLITFFTAGVASNTLPLKVYSMIKFGISPEINAISTLLLLGTFLAVGLLFTFEINQNET